MRLAPCWIGWGKRYRRAPSPRNGSHFLQPLFLRQMASGLVDMRDHNALSMLLPEHQIASAVVEIIEEAGSASSPSSLQVAQLLVGMVSRQSAHMKPFAPVSARTSSIGPRRLGRLPL